MGDLDLRDSEDGMRHSRSLMLALGLCVTAVLLAWLRQPESLRETHPNDTIPESTPTALKTRPGPDDSALILPSSEAHADVEAGEAAPIPPGSVSGSVSFAEWREFDGPISVMLYREDRTYSHDLSIPFPQTAFQFRDVPPGPYSLYCRLHHASASVEFELAPGESKTGIELTLTSPGSVLAGDVRDPDGNPVPDAQIRLLTGMGTLFGVGETISAADGSFQFRHLHGTPQAGNAGSSPYHIYVAKEGFHVRSELPVVHLREREERRDYHILMVEGLYVASGVVVSDAGQPVADVVLRAGDQSTKTGPDGSFEFDGLLDPCAITVALGEQDAWSGAEPAEYSFQGIGDETDIVFTLVTGGTVTGVLTTEDGGDVKIRSIALDDGHQATWETRDGHRLTASGTSFTITGARPGDRVLGVMLDAYAEYAPYASDSFAVYPNQVTDLGTIPLTRGGRLSGTVTLPDGTPWGETVEILGISPGWERLDRWHRPEYEARSDPDAGGRYEIAQIMPGRYEVRLDHSEVREEVDVVAGETTTLDLQMPETARVTRTRQQMEEAKHADAVMAGQVVWDNGEPAVGLKVEVSSNDLETDSEGRFRMEGLVPTQRYTVEVHSDPRIEENHPPRTDLHFVVRRPAKLVGQLVRRDNGQPVTRAEFVLAGPEGERTAWADLKTDGSFAINLSSPGPVSLLIEGPDFASRTIAPTSVSPGATTDLGRILLEPGVTVTGLILTSDGHPIPNARVTATPESRPEGDGRADTSWTGNTTSVRTALANSSGEFSLSNMDTGPARFVVEARGYAPLHTTAPVQSGTPLTFTLTLGGRVQGVAIMGTHQRPDLSLVSAGGQANPYLQVVEDIEASGNFHFEDVPPGRYQIRLGSQGNGDVLAELDVVAGETTVVEVQLP